MNLNELMLKRSSRGHGGSGDSLREFDPRAELKQVQADGTAGGVLKSCMFEKEVPECFNQYVGNEANQRLNWFARVLQVEVWFQTEQKCTVLASAPDFETDNSLL